MPLSAALNTPQAEVICSNVPSTLANVLQPRRKGDEGQGLAVTEGEIINLLRPCREADTGKSGPVVAHFVGKGGPGLRDNQFRHTVAGTGYAIPHVGLPGRQLQLVDRDAVKHIFPDALDAFRQRQRRKAVAVKRLGRVSVTP